MNLDKLFHWIITIVIAAAISGRLGFLQAWIWQAEAKVIYESRTSNWGSPRFFPEASARKETSRRSSLKK